MSDENRSCPTCGGQLPPDAPEGTCPKCLLAAGFESADGGGSPDAPALDEVARQFPELEIVEELGRGGMGVVYKARQKRLDRFVALKVLPREIAESAPDAARFEDRFTREARALARLSHPNIVAVHEFGEREGMYFFLMEYVDGANLRQTMRAGKLSPTEALAIVPQICDALQFAHDQGVVHRDIKPENVLLDQKGRVKIADFGLAKLVTRAADDRTLTRQGLVMGTPHYMAPEQLEKPSEVDHRADIYSLGVVLYEMLTGELPIGRFAAPSEKVQVDVRLDQVVLRSLEKEADRRYQAVSEVKTGIGEVDLSKSSGRAPGAARERHPVRPGSKYSKLAFWGLLLPVCGVALATALVFGGSVLRTGGLNPGWNVAFKGISLVVGASILVGLVLSVASIVQIRRSGGRLHGMGLAIAGLLLPLLCCLPGVGVVSLWLFSDAEPPSGPASAHIVPEPVFSHATPPAFLQNVEIEDLGEFRIEIELGAGEAAFREQRLGILGLGAAPLDAEMSTSSTPTWPPEEGTLVHLRGIQRLGGVSDAEASLLFADEPVAVLQPAAGTTEKCDVYVSAARASEIQVAFHGAERQRVAVYGRVVRPVDPDIVVPTPEEQAASDHLEIQLNVSARSPGAAPEFVHLVGPRSSVANVSVRGAAASRWPLEAGRVLVIESIALARASFDGDVRLTVGDQTFELVSSQTGRSFTDLAIELGAAEARDVQLEVRGGDAVTVDIQGRVDRSRGPAPAQVVARNVTLTLDAAAGVAREFRMLDATDAGAVLTLRSGGDIEWPLPAGHELRISKVALEGDVAVTIGGTRLPPAGVLSRSFQAHVNGESIRAGEEDDVVFEVAAEAARVVLEGEIVRVPAVETRSLSFAIAVGAGDRDEPALVHPLRVLTGVEADVGPAFIEMHGDTIQLPLPEGWEFRPRRVGLTGNGAVRVGRRRYPAQGYVNGSFSRAYGGQTFGVDRIDEIAVEVLDDPVRVTLTGDLILPVEADEPR